MEMPELSVNITANTDELTRQCRVIAKHLTAMADELEGDDKEVVIPLNDVHIHTTNLTTQTDADVERLMERIVEKLRRQGITAHA